MKRIRNILKQKFGYVSIEVVIIAGLIISIGSISIASFQTTSSVQVGRSVDEINQNIGNMKIFS